MNITKSLEALICAIAERRSSATFAEAVSSLKSLSLDVATSGSDSIVPRLDAIEAYVSPPCCSAPVVDLQEAIGSLVAIAYAVALVEEDEVGDDFEPYGASTARVVAEADDDVEPYGASTARVVAVAAARAGIIEGAQRNDMRVSCVWHETGGNADLFLCESCGAYYVFLLTEFDAERGRESWCIRKMSSGDVLRFQAGTLADLFRDDGSLSVSPVVYFLLNERVAFRPNAVGFGPSCRHLPDPLKLAVMNKPMLDDHFRALRIG